MTTQELIKELRKRNLDVHPLNIPFRYCPESDIVIISKNNHPKNAKNTI